MQQYWNNNFKGTKVPDDKLQVGMEMHGLTGIKYDREHEKIVGTATESGKSVIMPLRGELMGFLYNTVRVKITVVDEYPKDYVRPDAKPAASPLGSLDVTGSLAGGSGSLGSLSGLLK